MKNIHVNSWDGSGFAEQTLVTTTVLTMYDSLRIAFSYPPWLLTAASFNLNVTQFE